jgi:CheY-like chemotaxis protein
MAKKILLADDSPTIRKVVELTFADEGIEVYSVPDGDSAMVTFVRIEPDMVIADVNMPGMNGYRLCEMIKQDDTTHHIPVILLVGSFETFDPGEASRVGCDHYFTKPFRSIRELVDKVNECFAPGYTGTTSTHDTADIEHLYKRSLEPETDEQRAKHDVHAFTAAVQAADETHFDDGAMLEHFLSESTQGQVTSHSFERDPATREHVAPERRSAASSYEQISDDDEILDSFDDAFQPAGGLFDRTKAAPLEGDSSDDDVLGIDSVYGEPQPADDLGPAIESAQQPSDPGDSDVHLTAVPPEHVRTTGDLGRSPWEQSVAESSSAAQPPPGESSASPGDVLGDAGMDDEIIETSHPSPQLIDENPAAPPASFAQNAVPIDPFTERVAVANDPRAEIVPHAPPIMDADGVEENSGSADQPGPSQAAAAATPERSSPLGAHVTPELIESIVASVLEKMSDRAVRQAAEEAVPRIAEKLIREALTDDERNARSDAAKE